MFFKSHAIKLKYQPGCLKVKWPPHSSNLLAAIPNNLLQYVMISL